MVLLLLACAVFVGRFGRGTACTRLVAGAASARRGCAVGGAGGAYSTRVTLEPGKA